MKFLEKLFGEEQGSKLHPALAQPEREAIVDLLLLGIYVDNHLSLSETQAFDESAEALGWQSDTGFSVYLSNATSRARNARSDQGLISEFVDFAAQRLQTPAAKERALELLHRLLFSDGRTEVEKAYFHTVETALS